MGVATAAGLLVTRVVNSALLLSAVVTVTGTSVSTWIYGRVAKKGARPIDKDDCNDNCSR